LDACYRAAEDPWHARTNPEKRVRYDELERFLPRGPFARALELACGEGDFAARLVRVARAVTATDLSGVVLERARARHRAVSFTVADVREMPAERFREFELVVWLDAMYWLERSDSAAVLARIAAAAEPGRPAAVLSARIMPRSRTDMSYWAGHDFESPAEFLAHVRRAFPDARGVPVQLHVDLQPVGALRPAHRPIRFGLRGLIRFIGYRPTLRLAQRAFTVPFLAPFVAPFVIHLAAVVDREHRAYPPSVEDVVDRFINRPLAAHLVRWLTATSITPNQVTAVSGLLGVAGAAVLSLGSWPAVAAGALLLQLSIVVDCADGQLARAKGLTSQWGEVFDHTSDDLSFALVSSVLALTIWRSGLGDVAKLGLVLPAFVAALGLAASQYFYNEEYRTVATQGTAGGVRRDAERFRAARGRQPRTWLGRAGRVLLAYYALRLGVMHRALTGLNGRRRGLLDRAPVDAHGRRAYWELQALPLWLWRLSGMSSLALVLVACCLAGRPEAFAWLLAVVGLPYAVLVLWLQRRADRRTEAAWRA
jgi:SAM-dependent methyltransferase